MLPSRSGDEHVDLLKLNMNTGAYDTLMKRTHPDDPEIGAQVREHRATYVEVSEPHTMADCPFREQA